VAGPAEAKKPGTMHRPDLVTLVPYDLHVTLEEGHKLLRLGNAVANIGAGPLELRPEHDVDAGVTVAIQSLYTHDAQGHWTVLSEREVGEFVYHPDHGHWHFAGFARYDLLDAEGAVVRSSGKVSFCMLDGGLYAPDLPHTAPHTYAFCGQDEVQGISVGWADYYGASLPDQWVDVTGVPNGVYTLVSTADPEDRLLERNETNNATSVKIRIRGRKVIVLGR
jgi:hypothetical protein